MLGEFFAVFELVGLSPLLQVFVKCLNQLLTMTTFLVMEQASIFLNIFRALCFFWIKIQSAHIS